MITAAQIAHEVIADVVAPPPPVDYLAWAEQNIVFSKRESPLPGPYNRDLFPYFDEILVALAPTDPCRTVSLSKSAQLGGTVLANIFTGGSLDMDPADLLYVHPTEENARRWSKMKLSPMLKGTSALVKIFPQRARDGQDSVLYKERRDGRGAIQISGANSPASLSQVSMPRVVLDDLAKWEMNPAGDPETQANSRAQGYEFAKLFKISTPLVVPGCRITRNFEEGSQEYLYVPCPHCGHMQILEWENFLQNLDEDHPERSGFVCRANDCGGVIEDHHRRKILQRCEWRAKNPKMKRVHRSFHLWSAYSLLQSFERIAREWLAARGDPPSEQTFWNDVVGRAYRVLGEAPPWEALRDRGSESDYARGSVPPGFVRITVGIDCQGDRVEWQAVAWGPQRRRAIIDAGVIPGHISEPDTHAALNGLLKQAFRNSYGRKIPICMSAIDGNAYTEDVWGWARKHPVSRVIMVRGAKEETAPRLAKVKREYKNGKKLKYSSRFYNFASSVMKMGLYRNLKKEDALATGYVALPRDLDDEFYRQLTAETRKATKNKRTGYTQFLWVKDPNQANEALDTHLQAEAAADKLRIRDTSDHAWATWFAERECPPDEVQGDFEDLLTQPDAVKPDAGQSKLETTTSPAQSLRDKWSRR